MADGFQILHGDTQGLEDTVEFLSMLAKLAATCEHSQVDTSGSQGSEEALAAQLFDWSSDIFVARAPGRLDVMGGIADYSGSLVLQMPIREACHVAIQRLPPATQPLLETNQNGQQHTHATSGKVPPHPAAPTPVLQIVSFGAEGSRRSSVFCIAMADLLDAEGDAISYEQASALFASDPASSWAAYVAGTLLVLMRERGVRFADGISMLVSSKVPEGKGVSSSAAVEVAAMAAVAAAFDVELEPKELAVLCQMVENRVAGAPCGIMDQMASACGQAGQLLALLCQPAEIIGHVTIPPHIQFWGIDSGVAHSVGGADYGTVRAGAFMGKRIIQTFARGKSELVSGGGKKDEVDEVGAENDRQLAQDAAMAHLCSLPPHRFQQLYEAAVPPQMSGSDFLLQYGSHGDAATTVRSDQMYAVRGATAHPVFENFRVSAFGQLLTSCESEAQLQLLGEMMYQSHSSYSACGLGSEGTDRLVALARLEAEAVSEGGALYGAKITGGGCGGTVCIVGKKGEESEKRIESIRERYKRARGHSPYVFRGSSPGACQFGYLKLRRKK